MIKLQSCGSTLMQTKNKFPKIETRFSQASNKTDAETRAV